MPIESTLAGELVALLNRHSEEERSNTPDWILANYMMGCLGAFHLAVQQRDIWYQNGNTPPERDETGGASRESSGDRPGGGG